jgi:hypothetical protein
VDDPEEARLPAFVQAQMDLLQALRDTQIEHGQRLDRLEAMLGGLDAVMQRGFDRMRTDMAQIVALLTNRERDVSD